LEQQDEKEEAERLYVKLLSRNPEWEDAWFRLGYLRLQRGDHRAAAEAFQSCVRKRAEWPEAHLNLGLCYWNMGDRESAGKAFEAVIACEPTSIDALRGLAALAVEREDLDKALDLQAKLIEVGERTPELFYNTGLLLQKSGQFEDAIRLYQEALAEKPDFAEALLNLGHALKAQGKPDEARNCWRQALEQKPELAAGYFEQ
jgi:tetratricopeptide (TPR) repeat protein